MNFQAYFRSRTFLAVGCAALSFPTVTHTATLEIIGGDATYIQGNTSTTTNFGSAIGVAVEYDTVNTGDGSGVFRGLLGFPDLFGSGVNQIPVGSLIQSATLRLQTHNPSFNEINAYVVRTSWAEQTVTWQSFNNGGIANVDFDSTPFSSFLAPGIAPPGPAIQLDITGPVGAWSRGRPNYGILFINPLDDQLTFFSDDYSVVADRPRLTVVYQPVPEPISRILFAIGLIPMMRAVRNGNKFCKQAAEDA